MADNVTTNPGTGGETFATDDIAGVQYPRSKITLGDDGNNDGDVSASNPMPVTGSFVKIEDSPSASGDAGVFVLAVRADTDAPTAGTDGDYTALKCDEAGRLKVAVQPGGYLLSTGNITSATSAVPINVARVSNVMVYVAGTFAGVNLTFEGSLNSTNGTDGNWFVIQAVRTNANTIETTSGVLGAAPTYGWELSVNGLNWFRVRATAWTSGTAVIQIQPGAYATEPIPAAQISGTQPVSFTQPALVAGAAAIGDVGVQYRSTTTGAASFVSVLSPATPASATIKSSAGRLVGWQLQNSSAGLRSVKLFNATAPTLGTTSAVFEIDIPAGGKDIVQLPGGIAFATAMTYSVTAAKGLTDNTATGLAATDVSGSFFFS